MRENDERDWGDSTRSYNTQFRCEFAVYVPCECGVSAGGRDRVYAPRDTDARTRGEIAAKDIKIVQGCSNGALGRDGRERVRSVAVSMTDLNNGPLDHEITNPLSKQVLTLLAAQVLA